MWLQVSNYQPGSYSRSSRSNSMTPRRPSTLSRCQRSPHTRAPGARRLRDFPEFPRTKMSPGIMLDENAKEELYEILQSIRYLPTVAISPSSRTARFSQGTSRICPLARRCTGVSVINAPSISGSGVGFHTASGYDFHLYNNDSVLTSSVTLILRRQSTRSVDEFVEQPKCSPSFFVRFMYTSVGCCKRGIRADPLSVMYL